MVQWNRRVTTPNQNKAKKNPRKTMYRVIVVDGPSEQLCPRPELAPQSKDAGIWPQGHLPHAGRWSRTIGKVNGALGVIVNGLYFFDSPTLDIVTSLE